MAKENNNINNLNIPKGWKYLPFGNVFGFIPTLSLSREQLTKDEETNESIYNIHYGDIHATYNANVLDFDKELRIPKIKDVAVDLKLNILREGDLAIADASEDYAGVAACIELINIKKRTVTGGLHTFIARDNSGLTVQGFRTYVLKNPIVSIELKKLATGSKVYGISKTNLATLEILLPPAKEQTKIAQILSTWDASIETLQQLIAKKERRKKALMQKLLTGKIRFKEFKGEKWKKSSVEKVAEIKRGASSQYLKYADNGIRLLRINDFESNSPVFVEETVEIRKFIVEEDDILIAGTGATAGITTYIEKNYAGFAYSYNAPRIRCDKSKVLPKYLFYVLNSDTIKNQQKTLFTGNAQPFLDITAIGNHIVPLPTPKEQKKIASVLSAADEEIQTLKISLAHYKQQKQGLMQVLLTGKKRVK